MYRLFKAPLNKSDRCEGRDHGKGRTKPVKPFSTDGLRPSVLRIEGSPAEEAMLLW